MVTAVNRKTAIRQIKMQNIDCADRIFKKILSRIQLLLLFHTPWAWSHNRFGLAPCWYQAVCHGPIQIGTGLFQRRKIWAQKGPALGWFFPLESSQPTPPGIWTAGEVDTKFSSPVNVAIYHRGKVWRCSRPLLLGALSLTAKWVFLWRPCD